MSGRQQKVPLVDAAAKLVKEPTKDLVWEILRQMECVTRWAIFILAVCLVLFMIYQSRCFGSPLIRRNLLRACSVTTSTRLFIPGWFTKNNLLAFLGWETFLVVITEIALIRQKHFARALKMALFLMGLFVLITFSLSLGATIPDMIWVGHAVARNIYG